MNRPLEHEYSSFTAYTRALEDYCTSLEQPEQEPVAWVNLDALTEQINSVNCGTVYRLPSEAEGRQPIYRSPPKREWQGLTQKDIIEVARKRLARKITAGHAITPDDWFGFAEAIKAVEAKLKEKNHD